jgi:hypothetical protein
MIVRSIQSIFELLQARLDRGHDVAARGALELAFGDHRTAEFRHEHDILTVLAQHFAKDGLGAAAPAIDAAASEKGDAEIERLVDHRARAAQERTAEIVAKLDRGCTLSPSDNLQL